MTVFESFEKMYIAGCFITEFLFNMGQASIVEDLGIGAYFDSA
jgi:hypothetical protein